MRKTRRKQLAECNSSNATRRKQLVENKGRKTGRKLTRRITRLQTSRITRDYKQGLSSANCANYELIFFNRFSVVSRII